MINTMVSQFQLLFPLVGHIEQKTYLINTDDDG